MAIEYQGLDTSTAAKMALQYANQMGLRYTSGKRSYAEEMSLAGGSKTSMHLSGQAFDFAGNTSAMKSFASWAKASGLFTEVLDEGNHIHVGWATGKHPDGKTYVGNHTLIDQKGSSTAYTSSSPSNPSSDKATVTETIFSSVVRALAIIGFVVLGIIFLAKTFPVVEDATNLIPAGKIVKGVKKLNGHDQ